MIRTASAFLMMIASLFLMSANSCNKTADDKAAQVLGKEIGSELTCSVNSDCTSIKADCCGCNQGGKQIAINMSSFDDKNAQQQSTCQDQVCAQVISTDKTCLQKPACVHGKCELE